MEETTRKIRDKYEEKRKKEMQKMYPAAFKGCRMLEPAHRLEIEVNSRIDIIAPRKIP